MSHSSSTPSPQAHDKHFYDTLKLVVGVLIVIVIALIFVVHGIAAETQDAEIGDDPAVQRAINERIAPVGQVAVSGQDNSALKTPGPVAVAAVADLSGADVFAQACTACHGAGIAGAPKYGDKSDWGLRIAQGMPTLYQHALQGFQGKAGVMPAKGGRIDLSDTSIINGVDYMVAGVR